MRIGQGWDIHRLESGRSLIIGGVNVPSAAGSVAHSDGDALVHAVIDAILGAAAAGDIGQMFPDTSSEWKNADSLEMLKMSIKAVSKMGFRIVNIDSTVILQTPKLRPYIAAIRKNIAEAAELSIDSVSVKAKTAEGIGETGAGRAIEAQAAVLLED